MTLVELAEDERVIVAGNVILVVTEVRPNRVYLGFEADRSVPIRKAEEADRDAVR